MIHLLNNWSDVGEALNYLTHIGYDKNTRVYHATPVKNWDMAQVARLLQSRSKSIRILDMGCGGSNVLRLCFKHGFQNVYGIDIVINRHDRWRQLMYWKNNNFKLPYHLSAQSVTQTNFPDKFFDILICLSVIEHNVNLHEFFKESARILKSGGKLYVSTDYHDTKMKTKDAPLNYEKVPGEWTIFSKKEIQKMIKLAQKYGLVLENDKIPRMKKPIVEWNTKKYTFMSLLFTKTK